MSSLINFGEDKAFYTDFILRREFADQSRLVGLFKMTELEEDRETREGKRESLVMKGNDKHVESVDSALRFAMEKRP